MCFMLKELIILDERKIIEDINRFGNDLLQKTTMVNIWIKDTLNNELWTLHNNTTISLEANTDIIG